MRTLLVLGILLLSCLYFLPNEAQAESSDYRTTELDSFEIMVNETSDYGTWSSFAAVSGISVSSYVALSSLQQTHGLWSVRCNVSSDVALDWADAGMTFCSDPEMSLFIFDKLTLDYRLSEPDWIAYVMLRQYNGSTEIDRISGQLSGTTWQTMTIEPTWLTNATWFKLEIYLWHVFGYGTVPDWCDLYIDNFRILSGEVDVRIRYWNLYTGLGYYAEKLRARYWTVEAGWIDVWQNEFQAYKGDEVLVKITDIFDRNVWTGTIQIDEDPYYLDVLVPIVTVIINEPNWYNESVPMEWQITWLPYGPDGPTGMSLPAVGFEFEVLAGWYSISWVNNNIVDSGNQTVYIDGNVTERRSYMLTDFSLPIDPDYEIEVQGDEKSYDLTTSQGWIDMLAALYEINYVRVALLISGVITLLAGFYRMNKKAAERALQQQKEGLK